MQEQRFLAAAIEHERVAPLEPRHHLSFARLLGEQVADRLLLQRLGRRLPTSISSAPWRAYRAAAVDEVIVQSPHPRGAGIASPRTVMRPGRRVRRR